MVMVMLMMMMSSKSKFLCFGIFVLLFAYELSLWHNGSTEMTGEDRQVVRETLGRSILPVLRMHYPCKCVHVTKTLVL
jgi:hypothetical protein